MNNNQTTRPPQSSRDEQEIAGFASHAGSWWDPVGPFAPLHQLNPARIRIMSGILARHFERSLADHHPFQGLALTDVGCGGGLVTEPFARLGFSVSGLDASQESIHIARNHATEAGLTINYQVGAPEETLLGLATNDVVLALEVIEHVADMEVFIAGLAQRLLPGGLLIMSTINRTLKSLVFAKGAAEYVLRWVPPGTHHWKKFVRPSELSEMLRSAGLRVVDIQGMTYDMATGEWNASSDVSVNYVLSATLA